MPRRRQQLPTLANLTPERSAPVPVDQTEVELIALDRIDVDPASTPRHGLADIDELTASIRAHGLLQPVVVRRDPRRRGRYQLVAGHRRLAVLQQLAQADPGGRWACVPATVRNLESDDAYLVTLVENLQRDDLSPREECEALARLVHKRKWSTRQVAAAIKRSQSFVSKRLRVYEDRSLRALILRDQIPPSVAEELLAAPEDQRPRLARLAATEQWDQRRARLEVRGHTVPFQPRLHEQVADLRELITHSTLSLVERELLEEFARFVLETLPQTQQEAV
jgi:ParB family chromosome partitioning protein